MNALNTLRLTATPAAPVQAAAPQAPAQTPVTATPSIDDVKLSGAGSLIRSTGKGLAKIGGFGGLAIGAGLGLAAGLALGFSGFLLPVTGALTLGWLGADAKGAKNAIAAGVTSPQFQQRLRANRSSTPLSPASQLYMVGGAALSMGLGLGVLGGTAGLLVGVAGALVTTAYFGIQGHKAEHAVKEHLNLP
ncbi:MAG: hypothetical protein FJX76_26430 [Armatimonadetes bacterium]|nr:hypothetical protein [Armatimonadota bacterium]